MRAPARTSRHVPGAVTTEAASALRALEPAGPTPVLLGYYPVQTTNPFLALLYREARAARVTPVPVPTEEGIRELTELARLGYRVVLHLHWLNRPLNKAGSPAEARAAGELFLGLLDELHEAGGRVAWTVHNLVPHGTRYEDEERRFRGAVAGRADVIHVMAEATPELVAPYFELPRDRVLHVPHPNYTGAYADYVSREQARHELGLMPDELVYLVLGTIRAHKGIGDLLDAWEALPTGVNRRRLVIAGGPGRDAGIDVLLERAALMPGVLLHAERIESDRMQVFLRASDVAVLPYLRSLNSGALLLALTFDLPALVPAGGGLAELLDDLTGRTFQPGDRASLTAGLLAAADLATPAARAGAGAIARRYESAELSMRFARELRERLGWGD